MMPVGLIVVLCVIAAAGIVCVAVSVVTLRRALVTASVVASGGMRMNM